MMYPNEIKNLVSAFQTNYKEGNFEKAETLAQQLLHAAIEAKVQTSVLEVMNVGCGKHKDNNK